VPSRGLRIRLARLTCDEIMPAHGYRNGGSDWCGLLTDGIIFRFGVPPLQPGVVGSYPVQGMWFHSHLSRESTAPYLDFFGS
jgi:hypothetical protein